MSRPLAPSRHTGLRRTRRGFRTVAAASLAMCLTSLGMVPQATAESRTPHLRRVVHRFDFDEKPMGNFEPTPMHWQDVEGPGFPAYTSGEFDDRVGRTAPPSFHLATDGRSVARWYRGPATAVEPNCEYLIVGWVKSDHLGSARAALSAYYLDWQRVPVQGSQIFSRLVGGVASSPTGDEWQRLEVHLPGAPPDVRTIGLTLWVVQATVWDQTARPHRHIEPQAIDAGAWFDDITIYRMPSVQLTTPQPANIFVAPEHPMLQATVADIDAAELAATLTVRSVTDAILEEINIPVQDSRQTHPTIVRLENLEPGLYQAQLDVGTGEETVVTRTLRFAQLAPPQRRTTGVAHPFGITLEADHRAPPSVEHAYLSALATGAAKVPVWSRESGEEADGLSSVEADELLHNLVKVRVTLTAVFQAPPLGLAGSAGPYGRSLLEILADDPDGWRPYLAAVVAPNANIFRTWQIGADGDRGVIRDPTLPDVLRQVRREMTPLITAASLAAPGDVALSTGEGPLPAEEVTVMIDRDIHDDWIADYLKDYRKLGYERLSAYVECPSTGDYARLPLLTDLARRIIRTRHAGADTTYLPQLWQPRATPSGTVTEPTEAFIVYRTIVDLLRDLTPGVPMALAPDVVTLPFYDVTGTVLAMWDPAAPPEGRVHEMHLGSAHRQIDLWGRSTILEHGGDGKRKVRLYPQPVFIDGMERWIVELVSKAEITPDRAELSLLPQTHVLHLSNTNSKPLGGKVTIESPEGWQVRPRRFSLQLAPFGELEQPLELQYQHNEPAGTKPLLVVIDLESEPRQRLEIPLSLELRIKDVDVWGFAFLEAGRLVLRHGVTNRSPEAVSFRSFATVPGHSRQFRVLSSLAPGQTNVVEYRFPGADAVSGREVRLGLREVDGPRNHTIELTAP